jgi:hypothetical protein
MAKPAKQLIDEILATLTDDELTQINKNIEYFKQVYLNDVSVDCDEPAVPIDCQNYGFNIDSLNAKQRLYLVRLGYKVTCRYFEPTKNQSSRYEIYLFLY